MSLIQRKPRPLNRDIQQFRDDRLFIIACDDTYAPKQYFDFFRIPRIQVHVVQTEDGTSAATHVLDRLLRIEFEEGDERWLVLDIDHCGKGPHLRSFLDALKRAREAEINVAVSKPCFELWLLLHHESHENVGVLADAAAVNVALSTKLGGYNKTKLQAEHFSRRLVPVACNEAQILDKSVSGGDVPNRNTSRVYLIWRAIVAKALESQLPEELRELKK